MSVELFMMVRVWAAITGLLLAAWTLVAFFAGFGLNDSVAMMVAGIGGFELFLTAQDMWLRRRAGGSRG